MEGCHYISIRVTYIFSSIWYICKECKGKQQWLFPFRNVGVGVCASWARVGALAAPWINTIVSTETIKIPAFSFRWKMSVWLIHFLISCTKHPLPHLLSPTHPTPTPHTQLPLDLHVPHSISHSLFHPYMFTDSNSNVSNYYNTLGGMIPTN